jgi:transcriptional regulator
MYRPKAFQVNNIDTLVTFMRANSFATLVSILDGVPFASHLPLVVKVEADEVKLVGHLAKQNPQWQAFTSAESLAIFTGAHAYISPTLYEKHENVPTWNYIAVHAYGVPKIIQFQNAPEAMDNMIHEMIDIYEVDYKSHWQSLSDGYREKMMNGIVGFEMVVTQLEGKYKLSQNRSHMDQETVSNALLQSPDPTIHGIGVEMKNNLERLD